jgi:nucleotide-binding universal stress UspA family protein
MPFDDLLLHLDSYPDPTPPADIDLAVAIAAAIGGKLTAVGLAVTIPLESNRVADYLLGLSKIVRDQEKESRAAARDGLKRFSKRAKAAGVFADTIFTRTDLYDVPDVVAQMARTRDACLVPLGGRFTGQHEVAVTALFNSGRPVLIFKRHKSAFSKGLRKVVIAWDGGACAARAVAEALPILGKAAEVRILTVLGDKPTTGPGLAADLVRHLAAHGVAATVDEVEANGRATGDVFDAYLKGAKPDLLVMGGYGHSRLQELVLGGATEHVLWETKAPTFLTH